MKRLKILPKIFLYTFSIMVFIIIAAHLILYLLAPRIAIDYTSSVISNQSEYVLDGSIDPLQFVSQAIWQALPFSVFCCIILCAICSYFFSKSITTPIRKISSVTKQMSKMDKSAVCIVSSQDEVRELADNINQLYYRLFTTIKNLEAEKEKVKESEQAKIDFLRAASHELKTPVTALNATLENMILGVGSYCDYSTYLPECKDIVEQLATMIHEILETSKINMETTQEDSTKYNLSDLILNVCEPYKLIAATHGINLKLDIPQEYRIIIPQKQFSRAFSNIIANAVTYTPNEGSVFVCLKEHTLTVENECIPIDKQQLAHIFEPFYRPDFSRNSDSGGNGLGLYIVSTIFSSLHISYEFLPTESQKGMCFSILLPKAL